MQLIQDFLNPVYHLFFPNLCNGCAEELLSNEQTVCATCLSTIPKTKFHLIINNPFEQKFYGRVKIENATAMYYFNKDGVIQNLLHELKYKNKQEVGMLLGTKFAREVEDVRWITDIDIIMPIPLAKQKIKSRGFNQSECVARSMATYLSKDLDTTSVIRNKNTESQTNKTRIERMENVKDAFTVLEPDKIKGRHILLLDDIVTTGATLESCAESILRVEGAKVSFASLGYAVE